MDFLKGVPFEGIAENISDAPNTLTNAVCEAVCETVAGAIARSLTANGETGDGEDILRKLLTVTPKHPAGSTRNRPTRSAKTLRSRNPLPLRKRTVSDAICPCRLRPPGTVSFIARPPARPPGATAKRPLQSSGVKARRSVPARLPVFQGA